MDLKAPLETRKPEAFAKVLKDAGAAATKTQQAFAKMGNPQGTVQQQMYLSKLGEMGAAEQVLKTLEQLAKAKADSLSTSARSKRQLTSLVARRTRPFSNEVPTRCAFLSRCVPCPSRRGPQVQAQCLGRRPAQEDAGAARGQARAHCR